jgi:hypothetical protein
VITPAAWMVMVTARSSTRNDLHQARPKIYATRLSTTTASRYGVVEIDEVGVGPFQPAVRAGKISPENTVEATGSETCGGACPAAAAALRPLSQNIRRLGLPAVTAADHPSRFRHGGQVPPSSWLAVAGSNASEHVACGGRVTWCRSWPAASAATTGDRPDAVPQRDCSGR